MSLAKELGMCGKGEISSGRVKPLSKHLDTAVKCRTEEGLLGAHSSSGLWLVLLRWEHSAAAGQCCECWLCLMEVCCSLGAAVCMCCVSMEFWTQVGMMCLLVQDEKPLFPPRSEEIAAWTSYAFANVFQFWMMACKEKWAVLHKSSWLGGLLSVHTEAFPITKTQQGGALYLLNMAVGKLFASRLEDRCEKRGCCRPAGPKLLSELQYRLWIKASFLWALILVEGTAITK